MLSSASRSSVAMTAAALSVTSALVVAIAVRWMQSKQRRHESRRLEDGWEDKDPARGGGGGHWIYDDEPFHKIGRLSHFNREGEKEKFERPPRKRRKYGQGEGRRGGGDERPH